MAGQTAVSGYVAYRVAETEMVGLDLAAGLRHYDLSVRAALSGPPLALRRTDSWTDPVIGARAVVEVGGGWRGALSLDAGGFGIGSASDLSWQATAEVENAFSDRWSMLVGYRHLSIDRPSNGSTRKLEISGPVIGFRPVSDPTPAELTVEFTLLGRRFVGLNGGPNFKPDEAVSFMVVTEDQEETDRYWDAIARRRGPRHRRRSTMSYIDGFVIAVPTANKQKFIDHARPGDSMFIDLGASREVECWGDDVPDGKVTDFRRAVRAEADETVVFSWIEWPDKETRDAAMAKMTDWMNTPQKADPRMDPQKNPMPFDGKRMIFGGFMPVVEV